MEKLNQLIKECAQARKSKNFQKANYLIEIMLEYDPNNPSIQFERAMLLKDQKEIKKALRIFYFLLNTSKRRMCLTQIANINFKKSLSMKTKDPKTAKEKLQKAQGLYWLVYEEAKNEIPTNISYKDQVFSLQKLAISFKNENKLQEAESYYKLALEIASTNIFGNIIDKNYLLSQLGDVSFKTGDINNAINYYEQLVNNNIADKNLGLLELAKISLNYHQIDNTRKYINQIISNPGDKFYCNAIYILAQTEMIDQNYPLSIKLFKSLLNSNYYLLALEQLAYIAYKTNDYPLAMNYINQLIDHPKMQNKPSIENIKQLYNIIKIKLNKDLNLDTTKLQLEYNYNIFQAKSNIKYNLNKNSLHLNQDLDELFNYLKFDKNNYYGSNIYDEYYIYIPNIGMINNNPTDFIKVTTQVNTNNIMGIYPTKNKNNQLQYDEQLQKRLLQN